MLKIFFSPVVAPFEEVFPKERQRQTEEATHSKTRAEMFSVWKLLERALTQIYGVRMDEIVFWRTSEGKWNCDKCHFSLAHSHGVACVAVSDRPIGVDIENVAEFERRFNGKKLAALYSKLTATSAPTTATVARADADSAKQSDFVEQSTQPIGLLPMPMATIALWTAKEAAFKLHGGTECASVFKQVLPQNISTVFRQIFGEEWCVSCCGDGASQAEFFVADLNSL